MKSIVVFSVAGWLLVLVLSATLMTLVPERVPMLLSTRSAFSAWAGTHLRSLNGKEIISDYEAIFTALIVIYAMQEFRHNWRIIWRSFKRGASTHRMKAILGMALAVLIAIGPVGHSCALLAHQFVPMQS